jgi:hypothetical protein
MMSNMAVVVERTVTREELLALFDEQSESFPLGYKRCGYRLWVFSLVLPLSGAEASAV